MSEITIRQAVSEDDASIILHLIEQLARFEKLTPPDEEAKKRFIYDGFVRESPRFEVWLADYESEPVGYALIFETYSSFLCRPTLYLEDLFVLPDWRGRGIGTSLLDRCKSLACERGCGRMEWTCLDWNVKAQKVYEGMGASRMSEWLLYRLTDDALEGGDIRINLAEQH